MRICTFFFTKLIFFFLIFLKREDISQPFIESSSPRITYYQAKLNFHDFSFLFSSLFFIGVMFFFWFLHRKKESKCRHKVRQTERVLLLLKKKLIKTKL